MNEAENRSITLSDKYYFAAYLNMARHNVYILLTDINSRLGFEKAPSDDANIGSIKALTILKSSSVQQAVDIQLKVIRELHGHFAFLKTMMFAFKRPKGKVDDREIQQMEYAPADYHDFFAIFLKTLNNLRNEYSHTAHEHALFPPELLYGLRITFDAAVRKARDRFKYDETDVDHLVRQGKLGKEKAGFMYKFQNADGSLSQHGLSFFICMLVERKYATLFTQKLKGLKDRRARKYQATYEVFAIHSIRLPKARYTSDIGDGALLLDILNELKKCPDLLFSQLPAASQDAFRIPVADMPGMQDSEEGDSGYVLLKRHENRFSYFALRFMDEVQWFSQLRFPVDLGNYHYYLYDKTVDGALRTASLWEKVIGYGRLPEYQHDFLNGQVPEIWQQLWDNQEQHEEHSKLPYMPRTMPHYHLADDNISIRILSDDTAIWPTLILEGNDKKKNKPARKYQPDILISKYDLFPLVFYGLLIGTNKVKGKLEGRLIGYMKARRKLYEQIASGTFVPLAYPANISQPDSEGKKPAEYDLRKAELNAKLAAQGFNFSADDLPDEIKCYLMGVRTESFAEKAKYRIVDLLNESDDLLDRINRQLKEKRKLGSRKDVEIKSGVLASFLAKDIMLFQPAIKDENVKASGKATSMTYKVLQAKLALYGANVDTIDQIFTACNLIGGKNPHPFLLKVTQQKKRRISDFYVAYLKERIQYLEKCQKEKKYSEYQWLKNNQAKAKATNSYGRDLASRMLDMPVVIPKSFFSAAIKSELEALNEEDLVKALNNDREPNVSYLVMQYLNHHLNDNVQDFYNWERVYQIFNNYYDTRTQKRQKLPEKQLSEVERKELFKKVEKWAAEKTAKEETNYRGRFELFEWTEKQLRHERVQDIVLFLMCDYLLKNINRNLIQTEGRFFLKDFSPVSEKGILDKPMAGFGRAIQYSCISEINVNGKNIKGNTIIYQDDLKVKNIGDFNKFVRDRRLNNLLAYLAVERISRAQLEKELERYDVLRPDIFKVIHEFETVVLKRWPETDKLSFAAILAKYAQETGMDEDVAKKITAIRNAFSHNQYPEPLSFISDSHNRKDHPMQQGIIAEYFYNYLVTTLAQIVV